MEFMHKPVLAEETIEALNIRPDGIYVDGTLGGAGHSSLILSRLSEKGRLIGIDRDRDAVAAATEKLSVYGDRALILHGNFEDMGQLLKENGIGQVSGILLDLGVSSHQFDEAERGFSYREDARLDMRMDRRDTLSAYEVVNNYPQKELYRIIRDYGEDRFAANIAKHIVTARENAPVETTFQLAEIIKGAIPAKMREKGGHPAKRTFQAIRIEVNRELDILKNSLENLMGLLEPGGRLAVITFHSLEDRIVKTAMKTAENPCVCPADFPVCTCGRKPQGRIITRKPVQAGARELEENPRAHSALLRVFEKN